MAVDAKYGLVLTEFGGRIYGSDGVPLNESEEPVFVLRAQDVTSLKTLEAYRFIGTEAGVSEDQIEGVDKVIDNFRAWQTTHKTKLPD